MKRRGRKGRVLANKVDRRQGDRGRPLRTALDSTKGVWFPWMVLGSFLVFQILFSVDFRIESALALIHNLGVLEIVIGALASRLDMWLMAIALLLWAAGFRRTSLREIVAGTVAWAGGVLFMPFTQWQLPVLFFLMAALPILVYLSARADRGLGRFGATALTLLFIGVTGLVAFSNARPFVPAENIHFTTGSGEDATVAYVIASDEVWLVAIEEANKHLVTIRQSCITSRMPCRESVGHSLLERLTRRGAELRDYRCPATFVREEWPIDWG